MKKILVLVILIAGLCPLKMQAQWLEVYYAFELKDVDGKFIDSNNAVYKLTPIKNHESSEIILEIEMCNNIKTWRFTEGYRDFDLINKLRIDKLSDGTTAESMIIEFLPAFNKGEVNYYSNLYLGAIEFRNGTYKIKLPGTADEWDSLKKLDLCPQSYKTEPYLDVSKFQK